MRVARTLRKMLGGGMRQTGIIASCGLVALEDWRERLNLDNNNAKNMAAKMAKVKGIKINPSVVQSNIFRFGIDHPTLKPSDVCAKLKEQHKILAMPGFKNEDIRFVTHRDVDA